MSGLVTESNEPLSSHGNMKAIIEALGSSNFEDIKVAITSLKNTLCDKNAVEKLERFEENRKKQHEHIFSNIACGFRDGQ